MTQVAPGGPDAPRRTVDVVATGVTGTLGAGVFLAFAPAAHAAGWWLLAGLLLAALVAAFSAMSTVDLARVYPETDAGYLHFRELFGPWHARVGGSAGLAGRIAAAAAIGGMFGAYLMPARPEVAAVGLVLLATAMEATALRIPPAVTRAAAAVVLATLLLVVVVCFAIPPAGQPVAPEPGTPGYDDPTGVLSAAGYLFFAFMGFERAARPGPGRRSALSVPLVLTVVLGILLLVGLAALRQLGGPRLAVSPAPLRDALAAADGSALDPLLTGGMAVAALGAMLGTLAAARELVAAMSGYRDLPRALGKPGPGAAVAVGCTAAVVAVFVPPEAAMGVAATLMLGHLAFTNSAARSLRREERSWPLRTACVGLCLAVVVGVNIAVPHLAVALAVIAVGTAGTAACSSVARAADRRVRSTRGSGSAPGP